MIISQCIQAFKTREIKTRENVENRGSERESDFMRGRRENMKWEEQ